MTSTEGLYRQDTLSFNFEERRVIRCLVPDTVSITAEKNNIRIPGGSKYLLFIPKKAPFLMSEEPHSDRKPVGGPGDLVAPALLDFPGGSAGKEPACHTGDLGSIPGSGRSPREGKGYPLQYSGLEESMDGIVPEVAKSRTRLSDFHSQSPPGGGEADNRCILEI